MYDRARKRYIDGHPLYRATLIHIYRHGSQFLEWSSGLQYLAIYLRIRDRLCRLGMRNRGIKMPAINIAMTDFSCNLPGTFIRLAIVEPSQFFRPAAELNRQET